MGQFMSSTNVPIEEPIMRYRKTWTPLELAVTKSDDSTLLEEYIRISNAIKKYLKEQVSLNYCLPGAYKDYLDDEYLFISILMYVVTPYEGKHAPVKRGHFAIRIVRNPTSSLPPRDKVRPKYNRHGNKTFPDYYCSYDKTDATMIFEDCDQQDRLCLNIYPDGFGEDSPRLTCSEDPLRRKFSIPKEAKLLNVRENIKSQELYGHYPELMQYYDINDEIFN